MYGQQAAGRAAKPRSIGMVRHRCSARAQFALERHARTFAQLLYDAFNTMTAQFILYLIYVALYQASAAISKARPSVFTAEANSCELTIHCASALAVPNHKLEEHHGVLHDKEHVCTPVALEYLASARAHTLVHKRVALA